MIPLQRGHACNFFLWHDPPMPEYTKNVMVKLLRELRKAEGENMEMKKEIKNLNKRIVLLLLVVFSCCILLVIMLSDNAKKRHVEQGLKMLQ